MQSVRDFFVGFFGFVLRELPTFGLWLILGLLVGLVVSGLTMWVCIRNFYPRATLDSLEAGQPPAPRWLRITLPLFRWSWWVTWWSAIPLCLIFSGVIWGAAQATHSAVVQEGLGVTVGQRAVLPMVVSMWQEQAPPNLREAPADQPIPLETLSSVLVKACESKTQPDPAPRSAAREGFDWFTDVVLRKLAGWWLGCNVEHRVFYVKAVVGELKAHPPKDRPSGQATLRDVAVCGCQNFVEPQMAGWARAWVLAHVTPFLLIVLGVLLVPRIGLSLLLSVLHRRALRAETAQ